MKFQKVAVIVFVCVVFALFIVNRDAVMAQGPKPGSRAPKAALGTAFTYQGQLKNSGVLANGTCDFNFGLFSVSSGGSAIATTSANAVSVTNGLFSTPIDFGAGNDRFNGDARFLEIAVRCPAGSGSFTTLSRQALTPAPYALALPGLYTQQNATSPNIIGGYNGNTVTLGVVGATISGGGTNTGCGNSGTDPCPNRVTADNATVGGGNDNTTSAFAATIGGGSGNTASFNFATVGGGVINTASGYASTVSGGRSNVAMGQYSFAAGQSAKANHDGTFVWQDSTFANFASTGPDQFLIRANGGMGIGTNQPLGQFNVSSGGNVSNPQVRIDQTNSSDYARLRFKVSGASNQWDIAVGDSSGNVMNFYRPDIGNVMSLAPSDATNLLVMSNGARLTQGGTWTNFSDRNGKENFSSLNSREVLARLTQIPVTTWNYKAEDSHIRHMGPTAQDFYSAFGLGDSDKSISTIDEEGVALAAIQGLYQVVQEKDAETAGLKAENAKLTERITAIEQSLQSNGVQVRAAPSATVLPDGLSAPIWILVGILGLVVIQRVRKGGVR